MRSLNTLTARDTSQLLLLAGVRNAIGVVIPLVIGLVTQHTLSGVGISVGALVAGFAGMSGTARRRTRTMLLATVWMRIATLIGATTGGIVWLIVVTVMLSGFIAGMMVAVSAEAGQVGLLSTNALILISTYPQDPVHSMYRAGFVVAGGVLQTSLMILTDALTEQSAESRAVSNVYAAISKYAVEHTRKADIQVATAMLDADTALGDSYMKRPMHHQLRVFMNTAEQIRMYVVALARIAKQQNNQPHDEQTTGIEDGLSKVSLVLEQVAHVVKNPTQVQKISECDVTPLKIVWETLKQETGPTSAKAILHIQAIYTTITDLQHALAADHMLIQVGITLERSSALSPLRKTFRSLGANFTLRSTTFRHAVRVFFTLAIALIISRILALPHGYWLPLTTVIILKPDFTATFSRGVARILGTIVGIFVATLLIDISGRSHPAGIVLIVLYACAMYTVVNFNYALFTCALTGEIVVLLSFFQQTPPFVAMTARLAATVIGSCLAFTAYILWPSWQNRNLHVVISDLAHAQRAYFQTVLSVCRQKEDPQQLQTKRQAARLARTNAVAAVQQAMNEPVKHSQDPYAILGLLTAMHRFSDTLLSLEAHFLEVKFDLSPKILNESAKYIEHALHVIEFVIRHHNIEMDEESIQRVLVHPESGLSVKSQSFTETTFARLEAIIRSMLRMLPLNPPSRVHSDSKS
ncbi:hypothetical protein GCM10025859_58560 [Alicyclobacillus fastidiosus]|nr:hypothetical protein GCM10025859_58560 [Alicyclobacillus fastidiosus]